MTTIAYDKPIKDLIAGLDATGHVSHRSYTKKSVTFHHNGGVNISHQGILNIWKTRPASAHFDSDQHGDLAQYARVLEYAWAVANTQGNMETISIELANSSGSPHWEVAEATWKSGARLAGWLFVHVIKAAPSKNNVFYHHHWYSTSCAGPYMDRIYNQLLAEVQRWYAFFHGNASHPVAPPLHPTDNHVQQIQAALELPADGKWGTATDHRALQLRAAAVTHCGYPNNKRTDFDIPTVQRVIDTSPDGVWGKNSQTKLIAWVKGFQHLLGVTADGKWGNGTDAAFISDRHKYLNNF